MENQSLVLDLVEWVDNHQRNYDEVMDAWRTSCPRLTIWEDAVENGLVEVTFDSSGDRRVHVTDKGRSFLSSNRKPN